MAYTAKGSIQSIGITDHKTDTFSIREFVIKTDGEYPQLIKFQAVNKATSYLDSYDVGHEVEVSFDIRGNESKDGKVWNNLNAWKIVKG